MVDFKNGLKKNILDVQLFRLLAVAKLVFIKLDLCL